MFFFFNNYQQIAGVSIPFTYITLTAYTQLHPFLYTCWNIDTDCFFTIYTPLAFAGRTFICNHGTITIARRTSSNSLHLTKKSTRHSTNLPTTTASAARLNRGFVFGAIATAGIALDIFFYLDSFMRTFQKLFIIKFHFHTQVRASSPCSS